MGTIDAIRSSPQSEQISVTRGPEHRGASLLARLWQSYCELAARRRSRLALATLGAHELCDIGVTEAEARREAAVPFWRSRL
ncbi:DUF1127 domain-containing protein [Sinorhizobium fredii]|uniref:DUF1127 domain-containing protein n=1 Tax=Rhizobium fredii TaxID=380 RepID=UPI001872D7F7|nr:DUF1127 domain-containing protein [Sinorhizobium fredii]